jgi:hypothetical protein
MAAITAEVKDYTSVLNLQGSYEAKLIHLTIHIIYNPLVLKDSYYGNMKHFFYVFVTKFYTKYYSYINRRIDNDF